MAPNDVLALNIEYEKWVVDRAKGLDPKISPFEFFCAEQFLKPHILLSDKDVLSGIIGKSDDGGVDSFYFLVNGQLRPRNRHLLARRQILQRKRIRLHFILTDNENVLRPSLRRRLKRFLQPEPVVS